MKYLRVLNSSFFLMTALSLVSITAGINLTAYAQSTPDAEQIKDNLNQAIEALDSGNNTRALQLVELASEQLENMTGVVDEYEEGEEDESVEVDSDEDAG